MVVMQVSIVWTFHSYFYIRLFIDPQAALRRPGGFSEGNWPANGDDRREGRTHFAW